MFYPAAEVLDAVLDLFRNLQRDGRQLLAEILARQHPATPDGTAALTFHCSISSTLYNLRSKQDGESRLAQ